MASRPLERLDKILVSRGYASSRVEAAEMIKLGRVRVMGLARKKPSSMFDPEAAVDVERGGEMRWVGRGALKLLKALDEWRIDPSGIDCVDIGASTGGFTQVLLARGASRVAAVDVGYGQLAWELRQDPRVKVMERVNARYVTADDVGWLSGIAVIDASFISLRVLLPNVKELLGEGGVIIALVKPQFEVGRKLVGKGVVRDKALHVDVLTAVADFAREECGLILRGAAYSPVKGADGNIEFIFFMSEESASPPEAIDFAVLADEAHAGLG